MASVEPGAGTMGKPAHASHVWGHQGAGTLATTNTAWFNVTLLVIHFQLVTLINLFVHLLSSVGKSKEL